MKKTLFVLATVATFALINQKSSLGITLGVNNVTELINLFRNSGFEQPTVTLNETEDTFDLSVIGGPVESTGKFSTPFESDFWRGDLTFWQKDYWFSSDRLWVYGNIYHQAGIERPHEEDRLKGFMFTYGTNINSKDAGTESQRLVDSFDGIKTHPTSHSDVYSGQLSADVTADTVFIVGKIANEIDGWTFTLFGQHNGGQLRDNVVVQDVPEPFTILGVGTAVAFGMKFKRRLSK